MKFVNKMRTTLDTLRSWLDLILIKVTSLLYCTTNAVKYEMKTTIHSFLSELFEVDEYITTSILHPSFLVSDYLDSLRIYYLFISFYNFTISGSLAQLVRASCY